MLDLSLVLCACIAQNIFFHITKYCKHKIQNKNIRRTFHTKYHLFSINWKWIDMFSRLAYVRDTHGGCGGYDYYCWACEASTATTIATSAHRKKGAKHNNTATIQFQHNGAWYRFYVYKSFNLFDPVQSTGIHSDDALFDTGIRWKKRKHKTNGKHLKIQTEHYWNRVA